MTDNDEPSVLDYLKSKLTFWRKTSLRTDLSMADGAHQDFIDRPETETSPKPPPPVKLINILYSRFALVLSILFTCYTLFSLPFMANDANYTLVFISWVLAIISYMVALVKLPSIRRFDWSNWWASSHQTVFVLVAAFLIAFLLRFWKLGSIPFVLSGDEASHGLDAMAVINGGIRNPFSTRWSSVPTMTFFLFSIPLRLLGQTVVALRLTAVLIGSVTVPLLYLLFRRLKGSQFALAASALLATYHYHIHFSRLGANMIIDPFFAVLALYFLHRATTSNRNIDWIVAGAAPAFAIYFYAGARFVLVLVVACLVYSMLVDGKGFFRKNWTGMLILSGAFLIVAAPMLQYGFRFPDEFNARINQVGIIQSGWLEQEVVIRGESAVTILFDQFRRAALAFNFYPDRTVWYGLSQPLLDPIFGSLFILGLGYGTLRSLLLRADKELFYMVAWWWGAMLLGGVMTESPPSSMRLVTLTVPVCFFIALALWQLFRMLKKAYKTIPVNVLMGLGVILFSWISLRTYFIDFTPKHIAGGHNAEAATLTAPILKEMSPQYRIFFVGAPWMYWDFATNPYLVPNADAVDILDPITAPPAPDLIPTGRGAVFVILQERISELDYILQAYPQGRLQEIHSDSEWNTVVTLFIVPPG